MFIIGNYIYAIAKILDYLLTIFEFVIIARAIFSYVSADPYNPIVHYITKITEPVLKLVRKKIPTYVGIFDFSPIVVFLIIIFIKNFFIASLYDLALRLK